MKSNTRKKILALFAASSLAVAGIAWAAGHIETLAGTTIGDFGLVPAANTFNEVMGYGTVNGNINVTTAPTTGAAGMVLKLNATEDKTLTVAPASTKSITQNAGYPLQILINDSQDDGEVVLKASNGDNPISTVYSTYSNGTYVDGGTLSITNNNSLGQGWLGLHTYRASDSRKGATLDAAGTTDIFLGQAMFGGSSPRQPVYLAYRKLATDPATNKAENGVRIATFNVANTSAVVQTLILTQGLDERRVDSATAVAGTGTDGDTVVSLVPLLGNRWTPVLPSDANNAVARLYKTGNGVMRVTSDQTNTDSGNAGTATTFPPIRGMSHRGGTYVMEGEMQVYGSNATNYSHHFNGFVGNTWLQADSGFTTVGKTGSVTANNTLAGAPAANVVIPTTTLSDGSVIPVYFWNTTANQAPAATAYGVGNNNNPLFIGGTSILTVNRSQVFSDFNTEEGTLFNVKEYTLTDGAAKNYRPQIGVTLQERYSVAAGKIVGSADFVLNSTRTLATNTDLREGATPATDNSTGMQEAGNASITVPAQAMLTIANTANDITGQTAVINGVLAIGGAKSIGTGEVSIGTTFGTPTGESDVAATSVSSIRGLRTPTAKPIGAATDVVRSGKAVFLGLADATFENKTFVNGQLRDKPSAYTDYNVAGVGALAAATNTKVAYKDITVNGAMEINPQAVNEYIIEGAANDEIRWTNKHLYPTWGGTVVFGGASADYTLNGNTTLPTQIAVSRGTWQLDSYPKDNGFAQVMLRETATLSLAQGVNDFSKTFDVQVDDDARIRLIPAAADVANSRNEALANKALFMVRTIDTAWLGAGSENKDRRLAIQIDLSNLPNGLKKGQWIKAVSAEDAVKWNNVHYLRDNSNTFYEDYAKVRVGLLNITDTTTKVVAHVDENPYVIYLEVVEDTNTPTPSSDNFTFSGTSVATNAVISGSATLKDNSGAAVASQDVTFYLFHNGVDYADNTNAIENMTATTDANGVANYLFNKGSYGNNAGYVIKAVATGYESGTKAVATTGTTPISSGSSSGCDAGFGAFALLAMAGGALVLRKKD